MQFDFSRLDPRDGYKLMVSTVVPRPIAWVMTQGPTGQLNAGAVLVLQRLVRRSAGGGDRHRRARRGA